MKLRYVYKLHCKVTWNPKHIFWAVRTQPPSSVCVPWLRDCSTQKMQRTPLRTLLQKTSHHWAGVKPPTGLGYSVRESFKTFPGRFEGSHLGLTGGGPLYISRWLNDRQGRSRQGKDFEERSNTLYRTHPERGILQNKKRITWYNQQSRKFFEAE